MEHCNWRNVNILQNFPNSCINRGLTVYFNFKPPMKPLSTQWKRPTFFIQCGYGIFINQGGLILLNCIKLQTLRTVMAQEWGYFWPTILDTKLEYEHLLISTYFSNPCSFFLYYCFIRKTFTVWSVIWYKLYSHCFGITRNCYKVGIPRKSGFHVHCV